MRQESHYPILGSGYVKIVPFSLGLPGKHGEQAEFPLLGEVTAPFMDNPLALMNAITDEEGTMVPCPLPDTMLQCLLQMMSEPLSLYDDADIRTMLLAALMATVGSAMSHVRVRHHLRTLCVKDYIERLRQGVYRKVARRINGKIRQAA